MARIHSTAIVDKGAQIDPTVEIGPYAIVGPHAKIGAGTTIGAHAMVFGHTQIGKRCAIYPGACLGMGPQDKKSGGERSFIRIGDDNIFREYVTVHAATKEGAATVIGNKNMLMVGSHVAHDCVLGDEITMANSAALSGYVQVEDRAVLGGLVGIHQFVRVGKLSMIGGLSKAVTDVPPFSICDGHPARFYGANLVGLRRAGYSSKEALQIKKVLKILFASGLLLSKAMSKAEKEAGTNKDIAHLLEFVKKTQRGVARVEKNGR